VRWPEEEHGIGALPDCSAKLASDLNRSAPAARPDQQRRGQLAAADLGEQLRAMRPDQHPQLAL
jgi:hypothetical protein